MQIGGERRGQLDKSKSSHYNLGHHLVDRVTKANGAKATERFNPIDFGDKGDEGMVEVPKDTPRVKNFSHCGFHRVPNQHPKSLKKPSV